MVESSVEIYGDVLIEYDDDEYHLFHQIITRVVVKQHVETIEDNAFEDCELLKLIKLCDGLRQIGNSSFKGYHSLEKNEINSKLELIVLGEMHAIFIKYSEYEYFVSLGSEWQLQSSGSEWQLRSLGS